MVCSNCRGEFSVNVKGKSYCADCGRLLTKNEIADDNFLKSRRRETRTETEVHIIKLPWVKRQSFLMAILTGLLWLTFLGWLMPYIGKWNYVAIGLFFLIWIVRSWIKSSLIYGLAHAVGNRNISEDVATRTSLRTLPGVLLVDLVMIIAAFVLVSAFYAFGIAISQSGINPLESVGLIFGLFVLIWVAAGICAIYPLSVIAAVLSHLKAKKSLEYGWHLYQHHLNTLTSTAFDTLWVRAVMIFAILLGVVGLGAGIYKLDQTPFLMLAIVVLVCLVGLEYIAIRRNLYAWVLAYHVLADKNRLYPAGKLLAGASEK